MKKGSITRYDQELVLETIVDYDNAEISAWMLEPNKEEIGGGGGINNPILSLKYDSTSYAYDASSLTYYAFEDGFVTEKYIANLQGGTITNIECIMMKSDDGEGGYVYYVNVTSMLDTPATYTPQDAVNCQVIQTESQFMLYTTDPSQPASITIKVS